MAMPMGTSCPKLNHRRNGVRLIAMERLMQRNRAGGMAGGDNRW
jgi:hypothetical protein